MFPKNFKTSWDLSDITNVKWLMGGAIRITRKKYDVLGRLKEGGYKVYVKPATYLSIWEKKDEIESSMLDLLGEEGVPINVELHDNLIMQLSLFQKEGLERQVYYGIHSLDEEGDIMTGVGINLNCEEYHNFIDMLMKWRGQREVNGADNVDGDKKKRKMDIAVPSTSSPPPKVIKGVRRKIGITVFGWEWCVSDGVTAFTTSGESQGKWCIDPKNCLQEAVHNKPESSNYKLEIFQRKMYLDIEQDMFDAALAKLINKNIPLYKEQRMSYMNPEIGYDDYETYGSQVLESISIGDVFGLCKRAIATYQNFTSEMNVWLMKTLALYPKSESIFFMMRQNCLNSHFVELFDFVE